MSSSATIRHRLVPDSFYKDLVQAMKSAGFVPMHYFVATTDHDVFHVPAMYAQETTYFFYLPDRGFLVKLALSELIDEQDEYRSWWSGAVWLELDSQAMLEYEIKADYVCRLHWEPWLSTMDGCNCVPLSHVMGSVGRLLQPFRIHSTSRFDDDRDSYGWKLVRSSVDSPLTIAQLVTFVDGLRTHFGLFLKPKLTLNFSAFGFTNDYAWPGIHERFWRQFPNRLLKQIAPGGIISLKSMLVE